jgi:hypothetical protein
VLRPRRTRTVKATRSTSLRAGFAGGARAFLPAPLPRSGCHAQTGFERASSLAAWRHGGSPQTGPQHALDFARNRLRRRQPPLSPLSCRTPPTTRPRQDSLDTAAESGKMDGHQERRNHGDTRFCACVPRMMRRMNGRIMGSLGRCLPPRRRQPPLSPLSCRIPGTCPPPISS